MTGWWCHQKTDLWLDGFWSHSAILTTCEGEKGRILTGEDLGVEQMKAALEPWLSETLPVVRAVLSQKQPVTASPAEERLWENSSKIWVKAHN